VIRGRRSIRGFLNKPVSRELITEILELAIRAPSSMNSQPWHFYIISGLPLDKIRSEIQKEIFLVFPKAVSSEAEVSMLAFIENAKLQSPYNYFRQWYWTPRWIGFCVGLGSLMRPSRSSRHLIITWE